MRNHEKNRFQMIDSVVSYMSGNQSVTAHIPVIAEKVSQLTSIQNSIRSFEETRISEAKASAFAKMQARKKAEQAGSSFAAKLYDLGIKTGNSVLISKYDVTISDFRSTRDVTLVVKILAIKDDIGIHLSDLALYGVTQEVYDEYTAIVENYIASAVQKESSFAGRSAAIKSMAILFDEALVILKTLDRLVGEFRDKNPSFFHGYNSARTIRDVRSRIKAVSGEIKNAPTQ